MYLLIINANVWASDYDSVLIRDGLVIAVGEEYRLRRLAKGSIKLLDAEGRLLIPGLADAHLHIINYSINKNRLNLRNISSIEELKSVLRRSSKSYEGWIVGWGWDQERFEEKRHPTKDDLDSAVPDKPILLVRVCGHVAVANTKALSILGIKSKNGLLYEEEVEKALSSLPLPSFNEITKAVKEAFIEAYSYGLTELHIMSVKEWELKVYENVLKEVPMKLRVYTDNIPQDTFDSHLMKIKGVKVFMDGSFGGRTAALREPYSDDPSNKGLLLLNSEKLGALMKNVAKKGLNVAVHAIGDKGVEEVLKAVKETQLSNLRIEHASLTPPDLLEELARFKLPISVQPNFIISDWWIVDRLGERAKWVYPFKSFIREGLLVAASSDAPVEPLNPWIGVYAAVDRGEREGLEIWKISSSQKLSFEEALSMYIRGKVLEDTFSKESVVPNMPADLVLLNINDIPKDIRSIKSIKASMTMVNGRIVYSSNGVKISG